MSQTKLSLNGKRRRQDWLASLRDEAEKFDPNPEMAAACRRLARVRSVCAAEMPTYRLRVVTQLDHSTNSLPRSASPNGSGGN